VGRLSTATASVTVTVSAPPLTNRTPVAVAGQDITTSFTELQLNGSGSYDPDGDRLTYQWRSVDGRATIASGGSTATPTVKLSQTQFRQFLFELTVTDPGGLSSKSTVRVNLLQPGAVQ
jgi:hypothetical protein